MSTIGNRSPEQERTACRGAQPRQVAIAVLAIGAAILLAPTKALWAQIPVSIEIVLAVDTSKSINEREFRLQMKGIADAFRNPEIIALIGQHDGVAVALFQWSEDVDRQNMVPWHLLGGAASVAAFAAEVETMRRDPNPRYTGIGKAIDFGVRLIAENAFAGRELKIDISGDGPDNTGSLTPASRQLASALGIVINGLPILYNSINLDHYYRDNVISGPNAFIEVAIDYDDFAQAFLRKLWRELAPAPTSRRDRAPAAPVRLAASRGAPAHRLQGPGGARQPR